MYKRRSLVFFPLFYGEEKRKIALLTLLILLMSSAKLLDGLTDLDQRRERNSDNTATAVTTNSTKGLIYVVV